MATEWRSGARRPDAIMRFSSSKSLRVLGRTILRAPARSSNWYHGTARDAGGARVVAAVGGRHPGLSAVRAHGVRLLLPAGWRGGGPYLRAGPAPAGAGHPRSGDDPRLRRPRGSALSHRRFEGVLRAEGTVADGFRHAPHILWGFPNPAGDPHPREGGRRARAPDPLDHGAGGSVARGHDGATD